MCNNYFMKLIFKIVYAILKFIFRIIKAIFVISVSSYEFGFTYDLDKFEENIKNL